VSSARQFKHCCSSCRHIDTWCSFCRIAEKKEEAVTQAQALTTRNMQPDMEHMKRCDRPGEPNTGMKCRRDCDVVSWYTSCMLQPQADSACSMSCTASPAQPQARVTPPPPCPA
jgi:hypothetical protein